MTHSFFVMMPFGSGTEYKGGRRESDFILSDIITPSINDAVSEFKATNDLDQEFEIEVLRELEDSAPGDITESIIRHISNSYITIVDLSGRNPNVFFELGVRFALKRNGTILLVQKGEEVPFNLRTYRTVIYEPIFDGPAKAIVALKSSITKTLETLHAGAASTTDSLVFQALPDLSISGAGMTEEKPQTVQVGWGEYWKRVNAFTDELTQLKSAGVYEPDILVGISNGGLLLADSVLRLTYNNSKPLICMWANRPPAQTKFFENPINNSVITEEVLSQLIENIDEKSPEDPIRILVMDDIVGTSGTFNQLVNYFQEKLPNLFSKIEIRFIFVFTPREGILSSLRKFLLSNDRMVVRKYRPVDFEIFTTKRELPYKKSIHYGDVLGEKSRSTSETDREDLNDEEQDPEEFHEDKSAEN